eukprot:scaffold758_cov177-Amphora_coffeaeformis.AAC.9
MGRPSVLCCIVLLTLLGARRQSSTLAFSQPLGSKQARTKTTRTTALKGSRQVGDKLDLRLLLVDHYDSFTYNLVDMLGQHCVHPPVVIAADSSPRDVQRILDQGTVDGIILSPGPGNPDTCGPLASSLVETHPDTPVLGVCLGHQILGAFYGATCTKAPTPVHGQVHSLEFLPGIQYDDMWQGAFDLLVTGINGDSEPWQVTRYHSLHVTNLDETPLVPTAMTTDGQVNMAFRHPILPHFGVQFHPESVGSNHGWALLRAFCGLCQQNKLASRESRVGTSNVMSHAYELNSETNEANRSTVQNGRARDNSDALEKTDETSVVVFKVPDTRMEPQDVMEEFLKDASFRFWLDTADKRTNAMSVLGEGTERVEYWGQDVAPERRGIYLYRKEDGDPKHYPELDILTYLDQKYPQPTDSVTILEYDENSNLVAKDTVRENAGILPFTYRGGHVGYLGYEARHDTADYLTQLEGGQPRLRTHYQKLAASSTPTAALMRAERSYVYDHSKRQWYLVCLLQKRSRKHKQEVMEWISTQSRAMQEYEPAPNDVEKNHDVGSSSAGPVMFTPNRSKETYNRNFETCLDQIRQGESYELCLTNKLEASVKTRETPLELYRVLRRRNAAPFSSFFDWNSQQQVPTGSSFAICCSSPERFVSVLPGPDGTMRVEAKPIKGTCARVLPTQGRSRRSETEEREDKRRAEELRVSVKNRAENLMIVDLLRNDLSRVCRTGSVHVAKLMDIESFATVHQMVSTIRGTLDTPSQSAISTLRACFPGGSMTGAPKLRTMELLEDIEEGVPRGVYSGCLGYISANGAMDMNIVIRTAVLTPLPQVGSWHVSVGAGGAITILSESEDEYEEMILKASAVVGAVEEWAGGISELSENAMNLVQENKTSLVT